MKKYSLWNSDLGNGFYQNPILHADYSDPDVIRVGVNYFMVSSSFNNVPAIPMLHSKDLIHWKVINYVLTQLPSPKYDQPAHGQGVWAPSIRYYNRQYWVFYAMPDEGVFFSTASDPFGKWNPPVLVREGSGWIDPCPLWDNDGKAYLVNAFAKSRIGYKSILNLSEMRPDGSGLLDEGTCVFDGRRTQPTIEGPKLYKRNGYYYILAPAGGVKHGWQTALRSRDIRGPYEEKIVMFQGDTEINGPHQGGLVDTPEGEWWFLHFQDTGVCGRVVHLQPVQWVDDWPIIGEDPGGDLCGQPVRSWKKPLAHGEDAPTYLDDSGHFATCGLGLQWQWNANEQPYFYEVIERKLFLNACLATPMLCDAPNLLLQKFGAPDFYVSAKMNLAELGVGDEAGLVVLGGHYSALSLKRMETYFLVRQIEGDLFKKNESVQNLLDLEISGNIFLRLAVHGAHCVFSYSVDEQNDMPLFTADTSPGAWVGAKHGIFCRGEKGRLQVDAYEVGPTARSVLE